MKCLVMTSCEASYNDEDLALCSMGFRCLRSDRENKSLRENRRVKMIVVAGYHAVVCDDFILLLSFKGIKA